LIDREAFVAAREARWAELEALVSAGDPTDGESASRLSAGYRALCSDLATARSQGLPSDVVHYLDELAGRAHNGLYAVRASRRLAWRDALLVDVPREIRANARLMWASGLLFYGSFALGCAAALQGTEFAQAVLPAAQLEQMANGYSADIERGSAQDAMMAGFYVRNNIGIAFQCFATGIFFGVGTLFFLLYNGLVLGTVSGYIVGAGHGRNFLDFTLGHGAWELTGIVIAGGAGLKLGWALIDAGGTSRFASVQRQGGSIARLVLGAAVMIAVAAAIEGFWSAGPAPFEAKVVFAAVQWALVAAWITLGGRRTTP
jgi:uncharacterized membrane protein SpoIIM required for sporulation